MNKPKTTAVAQPQRVPTNVTPTNNPKEVQLQGGAKVVTPHNSSPKVAMPKGKPMPMIGQTQDTQNVKPTTKPVEPKATTPVKAVTPTPVEQKLTPQEIKKLEPKATTPVQEDKYAKPKTVHLKDYQLEYSCLKNGKWVTCSKEEWEKEQAQEKAKQTKPTKVTRPAKTTPSTRVSTPTGPTMTGNGVIIPAEPLKYGVKGGCVPAPGKTTCEEEKATSPNRLKGYTPTQGVEVPEASLPAGVKATATPAKQETAKLDTVDTPQRKGFGANKEFIKGKNLLNGYGGVPTMYGDVEIPEASLPTEAEMDAQEARLRAELEAEQLATEMAYQKAQAQAQAAKAQAQAAKQQQQNIANQFCSYEGKRFSGAPCEYCINHKPRTQWDCQKCCQTFNRPLYRATYPHKWSGDGGYYCFCMFNASGTAGYLF
ncbi:MAG: hypothetical protein J5601_04125 [Elusimicrobiaceae bacterium]|nr:hypothetical protein [Elusimicrobiaceae bacterium]